MVAVEALKPAPQGTLGHVEHGVARAADEVYRHEGAILAAAAAVIVARGANGHAHQGPARQRVGVGQQRRALAHLDDHLLRERVFRHELGQRFDGGSRVGTEALDGVDRLHHLCCDTDDGLQRAAP